MISLVVNEADGEYVSRGLPSYVLTRKRIRYVVQLVRVAYEFVVWALVGESAIPVHITFQANSSWQRSSQGSEHNGDA